MICYFANRHSFEIIAQASTSLPTGMHLKDDNREESINDGQDVFSGYLCYGTGERERAERAVEPGNYILGGWEDKSGFYTIVDMESTPSEREIYFYAESAGLDMISGSCEAYEAQSEMTLAEYAALWLSDTGFEIGTDQSGSVKKLLAFKESETAGERMLSIASQFGCEVSYSFDIGGMLLRHKYINFHKQRGADRDAELRSGRDFDGIRIKKSIADVATALRVTGGTPDGSGIMRASDNTYTWVKFSEYANGLDDENEASMSDDVEGMHFIGLSVGHATDEESDDPADYAWGMINKENTMVIVPSATGHKQWKKVNGTVRYTWIVFATDDSGSNMSDQPTDRSYVGIAVNKTSATKGTLASSYTWFPIDSSKAGRDIYISPSSSGISEGNGLYTWIKYADDRSGSNMSNSPIGKKYMGMRFHNANQQESTNPDDYEWKTINLNTEDGGFVRASFSHPGIKMPDNTFIWYWFSTDRTGANKSWGATGRPYLGLAYEKSTSLQSFDPDDYEWNMIDMDEAQSVTLQGMSYDDGDIYIDESGRLLSRSAWERYSRYRTQGETDITGDGHIVAEYESDTSSPRLLLEEAIAELKRRGEAEVTYEVEISRALNNIQIGDTVHVADPDGGLYLSSRVLKMETSAEKGTRVLTLGGYLEEAQTVSNLLVALQKRQAEAEKNAAIYTWTAYADSASGDGMRLDPEDAQYIGAAYNKTTPVPDLSNPDVYTWMPSSEGAQSTADIADAALAGVEALQPELIIGTHGTTATATWTGTSSILTEIVVGTRIQYKLSSAGAANVTLNLTLKDGSATGAKPVYYNNTTRLGTQYGINAVIDLIYDGSAWRILNPYTNSNTVGIYAGAVVAGTNGVKQYGLVMRDTATTWVSLTTTSGTGTSKARYTGGLYPDEVLYLSNANNYASGTTTATCYDALALNLQYSTNCGTTLTAGRPVYLVGELRTDGLFYLDTTWWTQTEPTTADGKTYIYLGLAYSTTNIYLAPDNTLYQYYNGKFRPLSEIEDMEAAKVATNYLSSDSSGVMVADLNDGQQTPSGITSGKNIRLTNGEVQIRDGQTMLASYGEVQQIGQSGQSYLKADYHSLQLVDKNDNTFFYISDLRGTDGKATITETFKGDGTTTEFEVAFAVSEEVSATDSSDASNTATRSGRDYTFASAPADGATVTIVYTTTSALAKAYTLGFRRSGSMIGAYSLAEGYGNIASGQFSHAEGEYTTASGYISHAEGISTQADGFYSHAEGYYTEADGNYSHAEGRSTEASGNCSHAEGSATYASGNYSHAEGRNTEASGLYSHTEGYRTEASGDYSHTEGTGTTASINNSHAEGYYTVASGHSSHAQNYRTIAAKNSQTALGEYNEEDTASTTTHPSGDTDYGKYAAIIGNGSGPNSRSNALAVTWDGDVELYLDTAASSGTIDASLYDAITALDWDSEVIV